MLLFILSTHGVSTSHRYLKHVPKQSEIDVDFGEKQFTDTPVTIRSTLIRSNPLSFLSSHISQYFKSYLKADQRVHQRVHFLKQLKSLMSTEASWHFSIKPSWTKHHHHIHHCLVWKLSPTALSRTKLPPKSSRVIGCLLSSVTQSLVLALPKL